MKANGENGTDEENGKSRILPRAKSSSNLFNDSRRYIPGGVNSPARAFGGVGGEPFFVSRAAGPRIYDVDGGEYIDYLCSWGALILGHAHPEVVETVTGQIEKGTSYGAPTESEYILARMIVEALPGIDMVRMVNSGTEAVMSAVRLARGYTGRDIVIKFDGCYHGHVDHMLTRVGSGGMTLGLPDSHGVPADFVSKTVSLPFNDLPALEAAVRKHRGEVACVIVEPVCGNMGVVPPADGFLQGARDTCDDSDALLVFDEVITGFRAGYSGAQGLLGVTPDITCLGKIIGGGFPVGAYGGREDIMEMIAPLGPVYQAGTLSGNPVAMSAGIKTLELLGREGVYGGLELISSRMERELANAALDCGIDVSISRVASMFSIFFTPDEVTDYETAKKSSTEMYSRFFWALHAGGVNFPPSQFESCFLSTSHAPPDVDETLDTAGNAFTVVKEMDGK